MSNGDIGYWTGSFTYTPSWSPGPISVNIGATDSNGVDWLWMQIAGWDSPPVVGQITQRAADHGGWPTEQYFAPRPLTLTIQASAPTQALRDAARAALQMAIPVSDFTLLTYNEPIPKQMLVRRSGQITESYPTLDDVQFQCVLISADPRKYTATSKLYTTSLAANQQVGLSLPFTLVAYKDTLGYWAIGDENAGVMPDSSGLGRNAAISGTVATVPGPAALTGALFSNVSDFATTSSFVQSVPTSWSLEIWFNTSALANDVVLFSGGSFTQTTFQGFNLILFTDNNIYFDWGNGTVRNRISTSGGPVTANTWHYVVATFDGTNSRLYLDGTLAATSGTVTGPMSWPTPSVGLAATYAGIGGNLFPISLCAAAIYPSVLNATQVGLRYIQPLTWLPPQPSGSSGAVSVTNDGSFETRPVVTINGPIIAPSVTLNGTRTVSFSALTLVSGDKLVIDTDAKTGYLNGAYRSPDISSAWWVLEPGMSTLQLGGSTSGGAIMQVAYRDAWI